MTTALASLVAPAVATVFVLIGLLHLYWAAGGRLNLFAAIPEVDVPASDGTISRQQAFTPSPLVTTVVAGAILAIAAAVAAHQGWLSSPVPHAWLSAVLIAIACVMFARAVGDFRLVGFFKRVRGSRFASLDTRVYSPLCVALGAGLLFVALV